VNVTAVPLFQFVKGDDTNRAGASIRLAGYKSTDFAVLIAGPRFDRPMGVAFDDGAEDRRCGTRF
jgi:hypothetical protein